MAVNEVDRRHAFFSFELQFQQLQRTSLAATHNQAIALGHNLGGCDGVLHGSRRPDVQVFPAETGVRARPGLEAAQAVQNFLSAQLKINQAIFFLQDGRQRGPSDGPAGWG